MFGYGISKRGTVRRKGKAKTGRFMRKCIGIGFGVGIGIAVINASAADRIGPRFPLPEPFTVGTEHTVTLKSKTLECVNLYTWEDGTVVAACRNPHGKTKTLDYDAASDTWKPWKGCYPKLPIDTQKRVKNLQRCYGQSIVSQHDF